MRVLEARFTPETSSDASAVLVGLVVCGSPGERGLVVPLLMDPHGAPPWGPVRSELSTRAMLAKLEYLVESSGPDPYEALLHLKSCFWHFSERRSYPSRDASRR
jgi:hypothetical protein